MYHHNIAAVSILISILLINTTVLVAQENTGHLHDTFIFQSSQPQYVQAFQKARQVIASNIKDGKFFAGANWQQVWTRDTGFSVDLACGLLYPDVSKNTLMGLWEEVEGVGECWFQDECGHFAGWPNLTDAIVGATGAWSLYRYTGDRVFMESVYQRTINSLIRGEREAYNDSLGLFGGCSTFMESNSGYPRKYAFNGELVSKTYALSTNLLYYNGYRIAAKIGKLLDKNTRLFEQKADILKQKINEHFWMPQKGYYAYCLDEEGILNERMEGTGESFAILWGVADSVKANAILKNVYVTKWGLPCQWPQYAEWMNYNLGDADYYHNGMIWPFVQGYWAWAASFMKNLSVFSYELDALTALQNKSDTYREFYRPENGEPDGSADQLWSASGFLSMVFHGLFGMGFEEKGIRFSPVVPESMNQLSLKNVIYRDSQLDIFITGSGTAISSFKTDGIKKEDAFFPASWIGNHTIEIGLSD